MPLYYNSKKVIPAPHCDINKEYIKTGDGTKIGSTFKITVSGKLVPDMGSPTSSGTFWTTSNYPPDEVNGDTEKMKSLLRKQEALRDLFSEDGHSFEIQPWDGSAPMKCRPRVLGINFPNGEGTGNWYQYCDYSIELEADRVEGYLVGDEDNFSPYIADAQESWQMEFADQPEDVNQHATFRLTHTLNATGKRAFNNDGSLSKEAWQQARDWVQPRLGIDVQRITASGVLNLPSYMQGYNHARSENVDELGGGYSVTETWLIASGAALEDFDVETSSSIEAGTTRVSIRGTVTGLEVRNPTTFGVTTDKYDNAVTKFEAIEPLLFGRAQTYSGTTLNTEYLSKSVGRNPISGVITYSFDYDDRPSMCFAGIVPGLKSENITVDNDYGGDEFATIFVLGRRGGPVLQDLGTVKEKKRQVTVELVIRPSGTCTAAAPVGVDEVIEGNFKPTGECVFQHLNTDNWSPNTGRFQRQMGWTYT